MDMLTQFVAAFDDSFVYRYTKEGEPRERIDVRYVFGPKQRVMKDVNDLAKTMTLPVVAIEQTSLTRDSTRVFNKNNKFFRPHAGNNNISKIPTPVPVNLEINVSILAKFKEDIDQIVQNFVAYFNPYIIISWKVPEEFGLDFTEEIRSEVQWSGTINYETPKSIGPEDKFKIIADTSFTIKGWVFPEYVSHSAPIYYVDMNFVALNLASKVYYTDDYNTLSAYGEQTDNIVLSAIPSISNVFYVYGSEMIHIESDLDLRGYNTNVLSIYGKRFGYNNSFYLSSPDPSFYTSFEEVDTATSPIISAFRLPDTSVNVINDNIANLTLSAGMLCASSDFTLVVANSAGWVQFPYVFSLTV